MASNPSSKRGPTKKLTRKLKTEGTSKMAKPSAGGTSTRVTTPTPADERRPLTAAELWDEEDAVFFQPYFDKLAARGL